MVRAGQVDTEPSAAARTVPLGGPHRSDGPLLTPLECVSILKDRWRVSTNIQHKFNICNIF
jgi:hypothetical protein